MLSTSATDNLHTCHDSHACIMPSMQSLNNHITLALHQPTYLLLTCGEAFNLTSSGSFMAWSKSSPQAIASVAHNKLDSDGHGQELCTLDMLTGLGYACAQADIQSTAGSCSVKRTISCCKDTLSTDHSVCPCTVGYQARVV